MRYPIDKGTSVNIQGLECHLPPEGYVYNILTGVVEYRGIYKRSNIPSEQYWERKPLPSFYHDTIRAWDTYDKTKKDDDDDFYDNRLEEFKAEQWDKRLNGCWYYNNGKPTYITGLHWLYLTWWQIDIGNPKFRIPDLEYFYFLEYCIRDPLCMGMVEITKRRFGKTFRAGLFLVECISRTKMAFGGIQSKTGKDASKFFSKAVVNPFRRLPKFFRPEYDMSLGVNPRTEIRFQQTNIRGKKAEGAINKDELGGGIDHQPSDAVAYDGQKLVRYVADESGKTFEADVYERHETIRYCLLDDEKRIIGKALYTTTVEKIDTDRSGIQDAFRLLWDESDQYSRKENGMTASGLYRFFMPANRANNFDKYGYPDEEKSLREILQEREGIKYNQKALFARIRKEPLTISEAFSTDAYTCIFNAENIDKREAELAQNPVYKRQIWFYRDLDGLVKWRNPTEKQKDFCWVFTDIMKQEESNQFKIMQGMRHPARMNDGAISVDGISNAQGGERWGSKICAWVGTRFDQFKPNSGKVTGMLYGKPTDINDLYDQVLLCAEYHGYQVFWEHVADAYFPYFMDRGRLNYLALYPLITIDLTKNENPDRHRGVPTTPYSISKQNELGLTYFEKYIHLVDWVELLRDAKNYDPNDRTKSDKTVSFLIWLVGITEPVPQPPQIKKPLVRVYRNVRQERLADVV